MVLPLTTLTIPPSCSLCGASIIKGRVKEIENEHLCESCINRLAAKPFINVDAKGYELPTSEDVRGILKPTRDAE